jgi:hypothetical protein
MGRADRWYFYSPYRREMLVSLITLWPAAKRETRTHETLNMENICIKRWRVPRLNKDSQKYLLPSIKAKTECPIFHFSKKEEMKGRRDTGQLEGWIVFRIVALLIGVFIIFLFTIFLWDKPSKLSNPPLIPLKL